MADEANRYYTTPDGSAHLSPRRLTLETRHNTTRYSIPAGVGSILRVQLYANDLRPFEILECPATANYIRVFANGHAPHGDAEARQLVRAVYAKFGRALWLRSDGYLYLHPAPCNSGELIVLDYEPLEESRAESEKI